MYVQYLLFLFKAEDMTNVSKKNNNNNKNNIENKDIFNSIFCTDCRSKCSYFILYLIG